MPDLSRIEDLRRRVQRDPTSIAFAQLAEELRRSGQTEESVDTCRAGLEIHPAYLSARVTLGRALLELNELDGAQAELEVVLKSAPENLAAIRGLGEIHQRRGELGQALAQYRAALALARNDPDLQETVDQLSRQVEPQQPAAPDDGLSFEQMQSELLKLSPTPPRQALAASAEQVAPSPAQAPAASAEQVSPTPPRQAPAASAEQVPPPAPEVAPVSPAPVAPSPTPLAQPAPASAAQVPPPPARAPAASASQVPPPAPEATPRAEQARPLEADPEPALLPAIVSGPLAVTATLEEDPRREHAARTVAALEQWLAAVNVARADLRA